MKANLIRSSEWSNELNIIKVDTIQDLLDIIKKEEHPIIISDIHNNDYHFEIEIYDDYRE